jgi:hypothetical protein
LLVSVCAIAIGVWSFPLADQEQEASRPSVDAAPAVPVEGEYSQRVQEPTLVSPRGVRSGPLPDASLPLVDQLDQLVELAEAGDGRAACRLVMQVSRCVREAQHADFDDRLMSSLARGASRLEEFSIDRLARNQERRANFAGYCSGVSVDEFSDLTPLLAKSIASLTPRQKAVLAMMRADGHVRRLVWDEPYAELSSYLYPQFLADHGYDFLMSAYHAADPLALEGLLLVHAPARMLAQHGVGISLPNPRLFLQYAILAQTLFGPEFLGERGLRLAEHVAASMTTDQLVDVSAAADRERARWEFAKRTRAGQGAVPVSRNGVELSGDDACVSN